MLAELVRHDVRSRAVTTVGFAVVLAAFAAFMLSIASTLSETIAQLTESFPEALLTFVGGDSPGGYVVGELFGLIAPAAVIALAVLGAASASAGEEAAGTAGVLMAQPVTRNGVLGAKALSAALSVVVVTAVLALAVAGAATLWDVGIDAAGVVAACVHLMALALFFGAVTLAVGAATGKTLVAIGAGAGLAVVSYLTASTLPLAGLDAWAALSPWSLYDGSSPLVDGVAAADVAILAGLAAAASAAAFLLHPRRDLKG